MSEHSPIEVPRQVWHSLVSMLRVYAHAATLNGKAYAVTAHADNIAVVIYGECSLQIALSPETGAATWSLTQPEGEDSGSFEIDGEGMLHFPAGVKELDTAAMDWMDQLSGVCELKV